MSIRGVRRESDAIVLLGDVVVAQAIVNPRRCPSVVSAAVARAAGVVLMHRLPAEAKHVWWSQTPVEFGMAVLRVDGRPERVLLVAVSDALTRRVRADAILGPDFTDPIRGPSPRVVTQRD